MMILSSPDVRRLVFVGLLVLVPFPQMTIAADDVILWRADYNAARKEAVQKGLPLLVSITSDDCIFCRKQDATTFRDPSVVGLVNQHVIAVRVNGNLEPGFIQALQVQKYPTTVIAAPDGTILSFLGGFVPPEQLKEQIRRLMPNDVAKLEVVTKPRTVLAQEQLASAQDDFRRQQLADCLDKCDRLTVQFADLPESRTASTLAALIKTDPERLTVACEQLNERTANLYLTLAETWMQKGQTKDAIACYEKVTRLAPRSRPAETAQARLTSLQSGKIPAMTTGFEKNK